MRNESEVSNHARREAIAKNVRENLQIMGENPDREGLEETPMRVAKLYEEVFAGYHMNPADILSKTFKAEEHKEMVIVKDIEFYSHCEHHMVPFFGKIHIGYIPDGTVVGISKLARLAECFARRLQIQERLTSQIADAIVEYLSPLGVAVVVEAEHLCMAMRGVKKPGARTVTSAMRGAFMENATTRNEFFMLTKEGK